MGSNDKARILIIGGGEAALVDARRKTAELGYAIVDGSDGLYADLALAAIGEGRGGAEAAERLIGERSLPVVFLVCGSDPAALEDAERIGAFGYIDSTSGPAVYDAAIKTALRLSEAERRLREDRDRHRSLLEHLPDAIVVVDAGYRISYLGPNAESLFGWRPDETINADGWRFVHLDDRTDTRRRYDEFIANKASDWRGKFRIKRGNGEWTPVEATAVNRLDDPAVGGVILSFRDLSGRKKLEQRLKTGNRMFQAVLDAMPQFICWKDRDSVFRGCNKNHSDLFGLPDTASIIGKTDWDIHRVPEQIEKFLKDDREVMDFDNPKYHIIEKASYPDGRERWLETNKVPLHNAAGKVYGIMIAYTDITERKLMEDSLAQERYLMGALMDNSSDFIYFKDLQSRFLRTNRALADYLGLRDSREMKGKTDFDFFREEHARQAFQDEQDIIRTGRPLRKEEANLRLNGPETWSLTEKIPLRDKDGQIVGTFGISRDITDWKSAQELIKRTLREKETLLRELYHRTKNNMGVIISLLNLQAQNFTDPRLLAAFDEAKDRIYAMALIHEKLYETQDLSQIDLGEYIGDLSTRLTQSYRLEPGQISISADIESVMVSIDTAIPCGLIFNELISNALKHAFPDGRKGVITVRLRRLPNDEIELGVIDDGIGVPRDFDIGRDGHMGLQTVQALVESQLGGRAEFSSTRGFACRIILKPKTAKSRE